MITFKFDGIDSSNYFLVNNIKRDILPSIKDKLVQVPGRSGTYDFGIEESERQIDIDVTISASSPESLRQIVREIATWLHSERVKQLIFSDEPDKIYYGRLSGNTDIDQLISMGQTTLTFILPDPHAFGQTKQQQIDGSGIEHTTDKQTEWQTGTLTGLKATPKGLELEKVGTDYTNTVNTWHGSHTQTTAKSNKLILDSTSNPSTTTINDPSGDFAMSGLPSWSFSDNMSNWSNTGWESRLTTPFTQTTDGAKCQSAGVSAALVKEIPNMSFPYTYEFLYKLTPPTNPKNGYTTRASLYLVEQRGPYQYHFNVTLAQANSWTRIRVVVKSDTRADVYTNGVLTTILNQSAIISLSPRIQFIIDKDTSSQGVLEVSQFYMSSGAIDTAEKSVPYIQNREFEVDLSSHGTYQSGSISFNSVAPSGFHDWDSSAMVEVSVFRDGEWKELVEVANGDSLPYLNHGDDLSNVKVVAYMTLKAYDVSYLPTISDVSFSITSGTAAYYSSGNYIASDAGIQQVQKARQAILSWNETKPNGTDVKALVSLDDGAYEEISNGGSIPQIEPSTDLSSSSLAVKFELSTSDNTVTPKIQNYTISLDTAYYTTGERISDPTELDIIEEIGSSFLGWDGTPNNSLNIEVYTQVVNTGDSPSNDAWQKVSNEGTIPDIDGQSGQGRSLYTKQVLLSDGTYTPLLHSQTVKIHPNINSTITYEGTAEAYPIFYVNFSSDCGYFKLLHVQSGKFIYIIKPFIKDNTLEIDCNTNKIITNGRVEMASLSITSDFFSL
ncbi:phage tail family protein [Hazenella sp. IB182357]|uniref:Phage tail family protein n=1 Tax=Polycladospora coralii TaxID=2771432 RepID=A0A926NBX2_9BACL|nr:distal tail protein Dit [Polycladospora coralii]MBD1373747.1 phage tail family protein [Polycladospora coralii]